MNQPFDEQAHKADQERQLNRQRNSVWLLMLLLAGLVIAAAFGFNTKLFGPENSGANGEAQPTASVHAPRDSATTVSHTGTAGSGVVAGTVEPDPVATLRRDQSTAATTEGVCIVAFPLPGDAADDDPLPPERRWLRRIVADIGIDLCDKNRALDASDPRTTEPLLSRCKFPLDSVGLQIVSRGSGAKHLVIVEFLSGGKGWKVHGYTFASPLDERPAAISRDWPSSAAVMSLAGDIASMVQALTDYRMFLAGVFTQRDDAAHTFAELKRGSENQHRTQEDESRLRTLYEDLRLLDPAMDMALYRVVQPIPHPHQGERYGFVMGALKKYVEGGGRSRRLRNLYAGILTISQDAAEREMGLKIAEALVKEERLDMPAYYTWQRARESDMVVGARQGMADHPLDGRYHDMLLNTLLINPDTVDEAVALAPTVKKLRPWAVSARINSGYALLEQANHHRQRKDWAAAKIAETYENAARDILDGWIMNPNNIAVNIELLLRAKTRDAKIKTFADTEEARFVFRFALIANAITPTYYTGKVMKIFTADQHAAYRAELRTRISELARETPDREVYLLADIALKIEAAASAAPEDQPAMLRELRDAVAKYRRYGGRVPELEYLWSTTLASMPR